MQQTAVVVIGYAVGLIGLIAVKILAPGFYAQKDIRTPVKIAIGVLIATQVANLALVPWLAHAGLALSVSLGACINALALYVGLVRRGVYRREGGWGRFLLRLVIAMIALAVVLWVTQRPIDWTAAAPLWQRAGLLALVVAAGAGCYFDVERHSVKRHLVESHQKMPLTGRQRPRVTPQGPPGASVNAQCTGSPRISLADVA